MLQTLKIYALRLTTYSMSIKLVLDRNPMFEAHGLRFEDLCLHHRELSKKNIEMIKAARNFRRTTPFLKRSSVVKSVQRELQPLYRKSKRLSAELDKLRFT
jgi:hypothetical protein